ncbi:daptide-type RiPP biosynthesis dehydogenase [Streptomyces acidiscabies]|uniref:daptide-type RiPP biosynthesis dehydogenase n=1 Tax=Streptomyces acidiscabies TaxID=42234 RepID=UPI000A5586BC|nr:daptide-type RiPP biosynthesis dehydogenase [Streptomyces acidiscabies]
MGGAVDFGGAAAGLGGAAVNLGGVATSRGGAVTDLGGVAADLGGVATSSAGVATSSGGVAVNPGGAVTGLDDAAANLGGVATSSGGEAASSGGEAASSGGAATSSAGVAVNPGGAAANLGGAVTDFGGAATSPGGAAASSGGVATSSAGVATSSAGVATSSGGAAVNPGGVATSSGGAAANPGGVAASPGGVAASPGGVVTDLGGAAASSGGAATSSGGVAADLDGALANSGGAVTSPSGAVTSPSGAAASSGGAAVKLGGAAVSSGSTAANPTNTPWNLSPRRPTQVVHGIGGLAKWLSHQKGRTLTLLADPAVAESETVDRIIACAAWADRAVELYVPDGPGTLESVTELAERLRGSELVVAIGGGTLLDQAKLAVLISAAPVVRDRLAARGRSGLVLLPAEAEPAVPVVTVPTTVGTGSELSGGACLAGPQGKRLVLGGGLQPDVAVLDPVATRTLPVELLAEGVFEVFFRVAGMYVGDPQDLPTEDAFTLTLLRRMTELGAELASVRRAGLKPGDALRLEIAKLSGVSHGPWFNAGRDPSACKGWYLANELSTGLGLRKMTAAAAVLPPLWRRIAEGDVHWGSARRLRRLWQAVTSAHSPALPEDPVEGIAALLDAWLIGRDIEASEERTELIARSTLRAWGDGLPTLGALTLTDVRRVLTEAVHRLPAAEAVHRLPAAGAVCQAPAAEAVHRLPAAEPVHRLSTAGAVRQTPAVEAVQRPLAAEAVRQTSTAAALHRPPTD